jgi:APA family basic amino acid/polyamine antiporter
MGVALLNAMGPWILANSPQPAVNAVHLAGWDWAIPVVTIGAALATLGALLALVAGIGRTSFAMAREGDLPRVLDAVHPKYHIPHRAEFAVALIVIALVLVVDLRGAIGFSSFGVLLFYFVENVAALRQPREQRRYPRVLQVAGALACLVLIVTLPLTSVLVGLGVLLVGVAYRAFIAKK